jgi:hypothetical protein
MGYDFHITRRNSWADEGDDITFAEFTNYVCLDCEFRYPGQSGDDCADWCGPESTYEYWLCWSDGEIYTKHPAPEFIEKMVIVARSLHAKVQGDDGEVYE